MIRILVAVLLLANVGWAKEGDVGGNGGDLVLCENGGMISHELLDYFEAAHKSPVEPLDLGAADWDATRKVEFALSRLRHLDPVRCARYEAEAKHFLTLVEWITQGPGLEHIPDLGEVVIPPHCKVKQVAIRRKTFHPSIKPYLIDERLWLKLDEDHKAGLILHEIIYGETWDLGQKTSVNARKYNALLSSAAFESMPVGDYEALVKKIFEKKQPVEFAAAAFDVNALQGQAFALSLRSLLRYASVPVKWSFIGTLPSWLSYSAATETLRGTAPSGATGTEVFRVAAHDDDGGAIAQIRIQIK